MRVCMYVCVCVCVRMSVKPSLNQQTNKYSIIPSPTSLVVRVCVRVFACVWVSVLTLQIIELCRTMAPDLPEDGHRKNLLHH